MDEHEQDLVAIEDIFLPAREQREHFIRELADRDPEKWTPAVAQSWVEATAQGHEEVLEWEAAGWTLEQVEAIHILGEHAVASLWRETGIAPDLAVAYVEGGVSIDEAEKFERDGNGPDHETLAMMAGFNRGRHQVRRETWAQRIEDDDVW